MGHKDIKFIIKIFKTTFKYSCEEQKATVYEIDIKRASIKNFQGRPWRYSCGLDKNYQVFVNKRFVLISNCQDIHDQKILTFMKGMIKFCAVWQYLLVVITATLF